MEFVNIAVPVDRAQEVYELLARKKNAVATIDTMYEDLPDPYAESVEWTDALLDRMVRESSDRMRSILGALQRRFSFWVSTAEIAEGTGLSSRQVVAVMGPFSKRVTGRYGMKELPFDSRFFPQEGFYRFRMPAGIAQRIEGSLMAAADKQEHTE